jgi:glycogen synthase
VLFVGRLAEQKGVRTLLAAARLVDAHVVLVGDGPERKRLEQRAPERVHFVGFVPHEQIPAILANGDVLVLPSRYEELGAVLVEALWAGLPVVASRVGGVPEIVRDGETGILVPPGDPRALAAALNRVLGDEALAQRLRANARSERDRWGGLVERTLATYDEIRRRSSPRSASASAAPASEAR